MLAPLRINENLDISFVIPIACCSLQSTIPNVCFQLGFVFVWNWTTFEFPWSLRLWNLNAHSWNMSFQMNCIGTLSCLPVKRKRETISFNAGFVINTNSKVFIHASLNAFVLFPVFSVPFWRLAASGSSNVYKKDKDNF